MAGSLDPTPDAYHVAVAQTSFRTCCIGQVLRGQRLLGHGYVTCLRSRFFICNTPAKSGSHTHTHARARTHARTHACTSAHAHTRARAHTHTHTRILSYYDRYVVVVLFPRLSPVALSLLWKVVTCTGAEIPNT